jgi:polyphosphate glucokinase
MKVLVIDVGGTNLKVSLGGPEPPLKIPSGPELTAERMARDVTAATQGWDYEVVSIGFPGPVIDGRPAQEPKNLGEGWVGFDFEKAFGRPVRVINDAAMQALGSYQGGRMLFLGLGTGLGSALVYEGVLAPLELAHLPYRKGRTYEDYLGARGLDRMGRIKWQGHVERVVALLKDGLQVEYVVLGGGQTKKLDALPADARRGSNANAITGGLRLWNEAKQDRAGQPFVVGPALRGGAREGGKPAAEGAAATGPPPGARR